MNAAANQPDFYRSEAFAEDVQDLVATTPVIEPVRKPVRRLAKSLRFVLVLIGLRSPRRRREAGSRHPKLARASVT